ncbi:zinc transporter ZitB [Legionella busanensis]|uniref:Zinc transporter ZitB n=1 Tax=Legionella busanensis TaxID=190655 RepID=A0A378K9B6_9GAMM|nr:MULTISPECIES: cation transporter [Legionella]STX81538.1 zinc transporter ZitB [Legionella busanensis]
MALDNLADAGVYIVIIYAVGKSHQAKARAARLSGSLLIILGLALMVEIVQKFGGISEPIGFAMIITAIINSLSNLVCLYLLRSYQKEGAHLRASYIFTSNDMLINLGIVLSGVLVMVFQSPLPDLIISVVLAGIGIKYGFKILKEANQEAKL